MRGRWGSLLACAVAALVAAGCGDSQSPAALSARRSHASTTTTAAAAPTPLPHPRDDRARAQLGLLQRVDVPGLVEQDNSRNHATCSPRRLFKRAATGIATSPHYTTKLEASVQQSVLLFRDEAAAARAFSVLGSRAKRRCIARYVQRVAERSAGRAVPPPTRLILTVEPIGQQSSSYRLAIPHNGLQPAADVLIDRIGRALSAVSIEWQEVPGDLELQEALVRRIAARVRAALAA